MTALALQAARLYIPHMRKIKTGNTNENAAKIAALVDAGNHVEAWERYHLIAATLVQSAGPSSGTWGARVRRALGESFLIRRGPDGRKGMYRFSKAPERPPLVP